MPKLAAELASLLARQARGDRFTFLEGSALAAHADATAHATLAGRTLGAYTLERPLGDGGMGASGSAAAATAATKAEVAVKFLNLALLGRGGAERFAREGSMLARLAHPNIARLLDAGVAGAAGSPTSCSSTSRASRSIAGATSNGSSFDARVRLFLDVLAAVAHAHSNLVLHRDLKPRTSSSRRDGQVKLLDFGIAKLLDEQRHGRRADRAHAARRPRVHAGLRRARAGAGRRRDDRDRRLRARCAALLLLAGVHPTAQAAHTPIDRLRAVVETEPRPSRTRRRRRCRRRRGARATARTSSRARCAATSTTSSPRR